MINKIQSAFSELTDSEKLQIFIIVLGMAGTVIVVLMAISVSRGNDVDYFKERLNNLEHRFNVAEKARDTMHHRLAEEEKKSVETTMKLNDVQIRVQETERWIEEYNRLPVLPRPKQPKQQNLRPIQ